MYKRSILLSGKVSFDKMYVRQFDFQNVAFFFNFFRQLGFRQIVVPFNSDHLFRDSDVAPFQGRKCPSAGSLEELSIR
jgi:hypothetical protein